eukprot:TRINITY_DN56500_c0_g1_i1.p1 TRINITY_DN56500_c0_g1~~TRINITY_DN56500_c0_g1_i1.p1  ORF type:complete len:845 (-),score=154.45 TRINITY_DN56500_c0_g1_i1:287-2446(-)
MLVVKMALEVDFTSDMLEDSGTMVEATVLEAAMYHALELKSASNKTSSSLALKVTATIEKNATTRDDNVLVRRLTEAWLSTTFRIFTRDETDALRLGDRVADSGAFSTRFGDSVRREARRSGMRWIVIGVDVLGLAYEQATRIASPLCVAVVVDSSCTAPRCVWSSEQQRCVPMMLGNGGGADGSGVTNWLLGAWSDCSSVCGDGTRQRMVWCNTRTSTELCGADEKPPSEETCEGPCGQIIAIASGAFALCALTIAFHIVRIRRRQARMIKKEDWEFPIPRECALGIREEIDAGFISVLDPTVAAGAVSTEDGASAGFSWKEVVASGATSRQDQVNSLRRRIDDGGSAAATSRRHQQQVDDGGSRGVPPGAISVVSEKVPVGERTIPTNSVETRSAEASELHFDEVPSDLGCSETSSRGLSFEDVEDNLTLSDASVSASHHRVPLERGTLNASGLPFSCLREASDAFDQGLALPFDEVPETLSVSDGHSSSVHGDFSTSRSSSGSRSKSPRSTNSRSRSSSGGYSDGSSRTRSKRIADSFLHPRFSVSRSGSCVGADVAMAIRSRAAQSGTSGGSRKLINRQRLRGDNEDSRSWTSSDVSVGSRDLPSVAPHCSMASVSGSTMATSWHNARPSSHRRVGSIPAVVSKDLAFEDVPENLSIPEDDENESWVVSTDQNSDLGGRSLATEEVPELLSIPSDGISSDFSGLSEENEDAPERV